jgi:predicted amidohydrolase YtcJ
MVLDSVRLFGKDGLFDLHLQDGRIARIVPASKQGEGLLALPAFCESHAHLFGGGVTLAQLNLSQVHDAVALRVALLRHAAATPEGDMVCAYGANYDLLGENRPDRHALDAVLADRPLCITSTDFHCAWANTAALQAAGILHGADAGAGAEVVMAPDGLATGELREFAAMALVRHLAPSGGREGLGLTAQEPQAITPAQRASDKAALLRAMQECLSHGITTVVNMDGNLYQADLLKELAQDGLPLNVSLPMTLVPGQSPTCRAELLRAAAQAPVGRLSFGRVKMFMDGVFDTWTAFRTDDYPQKAGFRSAPLFDAEEFAQICIEADALGLQIAVHAVGDGAVRATLDGYAAARAKNGPRDARHRIEHIDMIHPDDLPRYMVFRANKVGRLVGMSHPPPGRAYVCCPIAPDIQMFVTTFPQLFLEIFGEADEI